MSPVLGEMEMHGAALAGLPGMTPRRLRLLLEKMDPSDSWNALAVGRHPADPGQRWRGYVTDEALRRMARMCMASGVVVTIRGCAGYPPALADDSGAPEVLFHLGDSSVLDVGPRVAIVGTRSATRAGIETARRLGADLAQSGVVVVSGLAAGIDFAAHSGAVLASSCTPAVAVLGTSASARLAQPMAALRDRLGERGMVISETAPGSRSERWRFAVRNRIMAALADLVVVVECHETGGSLHTVRAARQRGVLVAAVPGPLSSPASSGSNALLVSGAAAIRGAGDVLALLTGGKALGGQAGIACPGPRCGGGPLNPRSGTLGAGPRVIPGSTSSSPILSRRGSVPSWARDREAGSPADVEASQVLDAVGWEPTSLDQVVLISGLALGQVAITLESLADDGLVEGGSGWWSRC